MLIVKLDWPESHSGQSGTLGTFGITLGNYAFIYKYNTFNFG